MKKMKEILIIILMIIVSGCVKDHYYLFKPSQRLVFNQDDTLVFSGNNEKTDSFLIKGKIVDRQTTDEYYHYDYERIYYQYLNYDSVTNSFTHSTEAISFGWFTFFSGGEPKFLSRSEVDILGIPREKIFLKDYSYTQSDIKKGLFYP